MKIKLTNGSKIIERNAYDYEKNEAMFASRGFSPVVDKPVEEKPKEEKPKKSRKKDK